MTESARHRDAYRAAVRVVDAQRRMLTDAGADRDVIDGLTAIVRYLHRLSDKQIDSIFGFNSSQKTRDLRDRAIEVASSYSLEDVERIIDRSDASRSELEAIAIGRFHVPKGSMRSLGNIDRLRDKISTFIQNERTHETITKLAGSSR